jgi:hypothetical protein
VRIGLSFTIAAGPRHRSYSQVRVPQDSWPHFTVSNSRLPQPGRPGPRIYIPQEQGGPVILQALGSLFVASYDSTGLRWRYSTPPPHGIPASPFSQLHVRYSSGTHRTENVSSIIACSLIAWQTTCPQSCSLATAVVLSHVYLAMGLHVTECITYI